MGFLKIWKNIISNPFEGFSDLGDKTKWFLPLISILILLFLSTALVLPLMQSDEYTDAVVRVAISKQAEKGVEMSMEQQAAMSEQMGSSMVKKITIISTLVGAVLFTVIIMLLNSLLIKILSSIMKEQVKFSLIFKILIFISIIGIVQSLVKTGITLSGDWARILNRVNDTSSLKLALTAPVSLAALFSYNTLGSTGYYLMDTLTDIFNWIYYIFLYAGLKISAGMTKKHALLVTIISAVVLLIIGLVFNLIS